MEKKVFIKTFGCQMNEYDSNRIYDSISKIGYHKSEDQNNVDCYILNTCHIRDKAKEKVFHEIGRIKKIYRGKTKPVMIIAGCVAQAENQEVLNRDPYVDIVIGPQSYHKMNDILKNHIKKKLIFKNKSFLITAGPTFEMIDPVRFIGNFSSGKMGYELAKEASRLGAKVHLISGPSNEQINDENIILKRIVSADEMFDECSKVFNDIDVFIMSAAVSDYKPSKKNHNKIKKDKSEKISLQLIKNKDILKSLASKKTKAQKVIGFSLETEDELKNATKKLKNKNLDAIILNSLNDEGAGFNLPTNKISFITSSYLKDFTVKTKKDVAKDILLEVFNL